MKGLALLLVVTSTLSLGAQQPQGSREEQNKALLRKCAEGAAAQTPDARAQNPCFAEQVTFQGRTVSRDSLIQNLDDIRTTFPDWNAEVLEMVAEGDVVVVRVRVSGTHKGVGKRPINGGMLVGVPPTGKRFEVQHIRWYRIRDGKIVEHYAVRDDIGMMRQLGLIPPLSAPK
jgi:predicted ester cyclase